MVSAPYHLIRGCGFGTAAVSGAWQLIRGRKAEGGHAFAFRSFPKRED